MYKAMVYMCGLNKEWYQNLLDQLANLFLSGCGKYQKTLIAAYHLVTNQRGGSKQPKVKSNDNVAFNTVGENEKYEQNDAVIRSKAGKNVFFSMWR